MQIILCRSLNLGVGQPWRLDVLGAKNERLGTPPRPHWRRAQV